MLDQSTVLSTIRHEVTVKDGDVASHALVRGIHYTRDVDVSDKPIQSLSVPTETSRMADIKQDHKNEDVDSYGMSNSADPKNMQELTQYVSPHTRNDDDNTPGDASPRDVDATLTPLQVQTLLQNMQDKFQTMSDQIIGRNILFLYLT